ncbi:hypothetical protein D9611_012849 [Ephemerocybe angulata]|uniref:Uncharacterized protein n=1 Tax=Ephemerocybe angulata TaxID=980116 RepID=A0A8H5F0X9_9AGAR|nr:hypothetical protein D9611_012849 [Tulosesus angulatus]
MYRIPPSPTPISSSENNSQSQRERVGFSCSSVSMDSNASELADQHPAGTNVQHLNRQRNPNQHPPALRRDNVDFQQAHNGRRCTILGCPKCWVLLPSSTTSVLPSQVPASRPPAVNSTARPEAFVAQVPSLVPSPTTPVPLPEEDEALFECMLKDYDDAWGAIEAHAEQFSALGRNLKTCAQRICALQQFYIDHGDMDLAAAIEPIVAIVRRKSPEVAMDNVPARA